MINLERKKDSLQCRFDQELKKITDLFTRIAGKKVSKISVRISSRFKDIECYGEDTIFINPDYKPELNIDYKAMIAHGFFHHVQYHLFRLYDRSTCAFWSCRFFRAIKKKIKSNLKLSDEQLKDLINNFGESSAMFFAVYYITQSFSKAVRKKKMLLYLNSKNYTPPQGKFFHSNDIILFAYAKNHYDSDKTVNQFLSYGGVAKIMNSYLETRLEESNLR